MQTPSDTTEVALQSRRFGKRWSEALFGKHWSSVASDSWSGGCEARCEGYPRIRTGAQMSGSTLVVRSWPCIAAHATPLTLCRTGRQWSLWLSRFHNRTVLSSTERHCRTAMKVGRVLGGRLLVFSRVL